MYRIKKYKKGWIVEQKIYKRVFCFIKIKWKHVTHYAGLPDDPFYYKTPEDARDGALSQIKEQINFSFFFSN